MFTRLFRLAFFIIALAIPSLAYAQTVSPAIAPWTNDYEARFAAQITGTPSLHDAVAQDDAPKKSNADIEKPNVITSEEKTSSFDIFNDSMKTPKSSPLESMYSTRAGMKLTQFGYDLFGVPTPDTQRKIDGAASVNSTPPMGETQDDFILSAGDDLQIVFTGQRAFQKNYKIDSQGQLLIPDFPPIPAAGRSIGEVRLSVQAVASSLHNTQAYVSLAAVRQIGVLVIGHVRRPGRQTLTVFHTILDALMQAGGVQKTGSLRQIKLVRDGRSMPVDLYDLLLRSETGVDLRLRDGDRIIIPAIGPTAAVAGEVKRPGVYELGAAAKSALSLDDMLDMGGGVLAPGRNRYLRMALTAQGDENVGETHNASLFGDGSILMVAKGEAKRESAVELSGATRRPGLYALTEAPTLKKLINSESVLGAGVYPLIGVIERWNQNEMSSELIDFPLRLVLKGSYDQKLYDGDVVHLFSTRQIKGIYENAKDDKNKKGDDEEKSETLTPDMQSFLKERSAFVRGAVRDPGAYPVSEQISLDSILAAAGGLSVEADNQNVEVTGAQNPNAHRMRVNLAKANAGAILIAAGDAVRVNQKFQRVEDKSVLIMGEVNNPGRYDLLPGDKVSDLLARAGGLTPQAYADGAIFSRDTERKAEEARYHAQASDMRRAISAALAQDDKKVDTGKLEEARALADELDNAQGLGRITVTADPAMLQTHPDLDMPLEAGDRLFIPKRALVVRVSGEVLSPAALQFRKDKDAMDYVREAGGFAFDADKGRAFVLFPDGSAKPLHGGAWRFDAVMIPPGSAIIVPRDPKPFDFFESAKDVSQILSNLAVTAIFVEDIRHRD